MDLSKLIHGFLWSALWNCRNSFMDFFTLLHRLVKDFLCFSRILPNKTKLKFDQFVYMILSILRERYQFLVWPHFGETIYYCGSSRTTDRNQLAWSSLPPISAQPSTPHMRNIVHCIVQILQCVKKNDVTWVRDIIRAIQCKLYFLIKSVIWQCNVCK